VTVFERLKKWIPSLVVCSFIFYTSSIPGQVINDAGLGKESYHIAVHFLQFFLLGITLYKGTKNVLYSTLLTILYGLFDEAHQSFTPFRSPSLFDLYVDSSAALFSGGILWKLYPHLPKPLRNWLNA
jgi:hypothetical protein